MISQLLSFLLVIVASGANLEAAAATAVAPYPNSTNVPPAHPLPPVVCNGTTLCLDVDEGVKDYCSVPDDPMCSPCWDNCTHHSEWAVLHCWEWSCGPRPSPRTLPTSAPPTPAALSPRAPAPTHPLPPVICNETTSCLDVDLGARDFCQVLDDIGCSPCHNNCTRHVEEAVLHCWQWGCGGPSPIPPTPSSGDVRVVVLGCLLAASACLTCCCAFKTGRNAIAFLGRLLWVGVKAVMCGAFNGCAKLLICLHCGWERLVEAPGSQQQLHPQQQEQDPPQQQEDQQQQQVQASGSGGAQEAPIIKVGTKQRLSDKRAAHSLNNEAFSLYSDSEEERQ